MWKTCLLVVLSGGCATAGLKPVGAERVPEHEPPGAQRVAVLSMADLRALGRVYEDARANIWHFKEGQDVCYFSDRAIGITVWEPDASGMRFVRVTYRPDFCADEPIPFPIVHRSLSYVLTPDGNLLGPSVRRD